MCIRDSKLIRTIGEDVIGHQVKAHGIAVDAQDNVWICDANGSTVMKLSPEGKLLMTIGIRGKRGDWNCLLYTSPDLWPMHTLRQIRLCQCENGCVDAFP